MTISFHDHSPHLLDLIRLLVPALRLQMQDFLDLGPRDDVMTAAEPNAVTELSTPATIKAPWRAPSSGRVA